MKWQKSMDYKLNELFSVAKAADGVQLFHIIIDFDGENKTNTSNVSSLCVRTLLLLLSMQLVSM